MESLTFNSGGQWSLHKSSDPDADNFNSYSQHTKDGSLPVDRGTKGMLHNVGNVRAQKHTSPEKMAGKVPQPVRSADDANNPGSPGPVGDRRKYK